MTDSTIFVLNTTGSDSLETAVLDLQFTFGEGGVEVPGDSITYMFFEIQYDTTKLTLQAADAVNWNNAIDFRAGDDAGEYVLEFYRDPEDTAPPPYLAVPETTLTTIARLTFTAKCQYEGDTNEVVISRSSSRVFVDGVAYEPQDPLTCPECWNDGEVTIADYLCTSSIHNTVLVGRVGEDVILPVLETSNFRQSALVHTIHYDTSKLEFIEVIDDYAVFPAGAYVYFDSATYALWVHLQSDVYGVVKVEPLYEPDTIYKLKFRVKGVWDGEEARIWFDPADCLVRVWMQQGIVSWCSGAGVNAMAFDPDTTRVQLHAYTAHVTGATETDDVRPGGDDTVAYRLDLSSYFASGMVADEDSLEGNMTFAFRLDDRLRYNGEADLNGIDFSGNYWSPTASQDNRLRPRGALAIGDKRLVMSQIWNDTFPSLNRWYSTDTAETSIISMSFDVTSPPATYDDRLIPIEMADTVKFGGVTYQSRMVDTLGLVTANADNGKLTWDIEPIEIGMGDIYTSGGSGSTVTRDIKIRNSFDMHGFAFHLQVGTDYRIDTIVVSDSVTVTEDLCDPGYSCFTIASNEGTVWSATGSDWTVIGSVTYKLDHACYCDHSYSDYAYLTVDSIWDGNGNARYYAVTDSIFLSVGCSGCYNPSCPVLYTFNGSDFARENPLLTECESQGYTANVIDYYHVAGPVTSVNGDIKFQLRELEDEKSFIEDLQLITVDHPAGTRVGCSSDGEIYTYTEVIEPLSAVDQDGNDHLEEIRAMDDTYFESSKSGYLVVTFPAADGKRGGFNLANSQKLPCPPPHDEITKMAPDKPAELADLKVEILDENGNWRDYTTVPPRQWYSHTIVNADRSITQSAGTVTLRLSWSKQYRTDAVTQFIAAEEEPVIRSWQPEGLTSRKSDGVEKRLTGLTAGEPLELVKGDVLDFSFACDDPDDAVERDYIIRAVGRYQPDYSVYTNLLPGGYQLYDNYPNPFNPTTTISYDLPQAAQVKLEVFNLLGQQVATLVDEFQQAGHHQVVWDGTNTGGSAAASGVYLYRITANDFSESKKMMLVK
ncbi:MAG: FlgD immunoglobulin-like domain containing protein [Candidatus Zixiibacteriota bacterium]